MSVPSRAATLAAAAGTLARQAPAPRAAARRWPTQSLSHGAAGIALLHIERAHLGAGSWRDAHSWVRAAAGDPVSAAADTGLFFGAPALAFVLHAAGADGIARYAPALDGLDTHVTALTHRRVESALARIDRRELAAFAEYDLLRGLTGIGAHLLRYAPGNDALGRVLTYLVRFTEPLNIDGETVPGWWVAHDPYLTDSPAFSGGHANLGMAHGIAAPLSLLSLSLRRGVVVDGHTEAIRRICSWLDAWRHDTDLGPWWPQWITRDQLRTGRPSQQGPLRPSWCYGTPGLARAQQIAAIATSDTQRRRIAERALARALADPPQLGHITDAGLCHGWAGLYQTVWHAARDALTPTIAAILPRLADQLTRRHRPPYDAGAGLLDGDTGLALALHTAARAAPPVCGWDACLLIN